MIGPEITLQALRDAGTPLGDPRLVDPYDGRVAYAWLRDAMRRHVPGYQGPSLWWAWHTIDGVAGKRPDLRARRRRRRCEPGAGSGRSV